MKLLRSTSHPTFGRWFFAAVIAGIALGELVTWTLSPLLGLQFDPFVVGVVSTGLVAMLAAVLFRDADLG